MERRLSKELIYFFFHFVNRNKISRRKNKGLKSFSSTELPQLICVGLASCGKQLAKTDNTIHAVKFDPFPIHSFCLFKGNFYQQGDRDS